MSEQLAHIRHDYLRYANCWEDADLLLHALKIKKGETVISIASGGDNSFSLLTGDPSKVIAVDLNVVQIKVTELKKAAFQSLTYPEFLEFLGFRHSKSRLEYWRRIRPQLEPNTRLYWDEKFQWIQNGLISSGKFEKYFKLFRTYVLPLVHKKKTLDELLRQKSASEQREFYHKRWNTWRWRLVFKFFFSRFIMGRFGRDPAFLRYVTEHVGEFIFNRAEHHLQSTACQSNPYLEFIFTGQFSKSLPHYARPENFDKIKSNIQNLTLFEGPIHLVAAEEVHAFNLSNIFEYFDEDTFDKVAHGIISKAAPDARFAYWNLMIKRSLSDADSRIHAFGGEIAHIDMGFFYRDFKIQMLK